jgi:hypothetical protein
MGRDLQPALNKTVNPTGFKGDFNFPGFQFEPELSSRFFQNKVPLPGNDGMVFSSFQMEFLVMAEAIPFLNIQVADLLSKNPGQGQKHNDIFPIPGKHVQKPFFEAEGAHTV